MGLMSAMVSKADTRHSHYLVESLHGVHCMAVMLLQVDIVSSSRHTYSGQVIVTAAAPPYQARAVRANRFIAKRGDSKDKMSSKRTQSRRAITSSNLLQ